MAEPQRKEAPRTFDFRRARPLIVDDNPQALELLAQVMVGFQVRHTVQLRSVAEAVEQVGSESFDLIIVDGEMPDQDGFDLTRYIRSEPTAPNFTTPVIVVSGHTPRDKICKARDVGANAVITKPIVPGVLLARIEWLARHPRQFVTSPTYCGPDRRFRIAPLPPGIAERRADAIKLMAEPDRAMSQNDIDSLFG